MAYHELIKSFDRIRHYMQQFYVYGFKSRAEYREKSIRSYDNERRRIDSWLGDYMLFRQNETGRNTFRSVDSRRILNNPLYKAFKAKSFTANDISLHFYILDILADGKRCTVREIAKRIDTDYLSAFDSLYELDESTIRKKIKEYEALGLLCSERQGKESHYRLAETSVYLEAWRDALAFFSEADPLGVVGSFLLDQFETMPDYFSWKHHYILHALESEVLFALLEAIGEQRSIAMLVDSTHMQKPTEHKVIPLKIYISTQNGRRYLMSWNYRIKKIILYRLDHIHAVKPGEVVQKIDKYKGYARRFQENLWGVSSGVDFSLDHVEMTVCVGEGEEYILKRLEREKRCGRIERVDEHKYCFVADIYDATEMLPWIRTFIGRITELQSNNEYMVNTFYEDLQAMEQMYGGENHAIQ